MADAKRAKRDSADTENLAAPEGKESKYALLEHERRFLFENCPGGAVIRSVEITDRYLRGTRMRLRESVDRTGDATRSLYKLTQKIPARDGGPGLITTLYLDADEYNAIAALPSDVLRKTRLSIPPLGVDIFRGRLDGLVLAEAEFDTAASMQAFSAPTASRAEVTLDVRFTGGRLASVSRDELRSDLRQFGIEISAP